MNGVTRKIVMVISFLSVLFSFFNIFRYSLTLPIYNNLLNGNLISHNVSGILYYLTEIKSEFVHSNSIYLIIS